MNSQLESEDGFVLKNRFEMLALKNFSIKKKNLSQNIYYLWNIRKFDFLFYRLNEIDDEPMEQMAAIQRIVQK